MQTFLKKAKRKQKWMTFAMIQRLACKRNNLRCAPSILKHHVSAEVCLLGHQWISRGFTLTQYLGKGSVGSISAKPKDSLDIDYPRNEGRLANQFFPRNLLWMFLWDPTVKRQYPKPPPSPLQKVDFFSDWVGLFEICFRSSKMTDPRPCPTGWAYFKALSRSTKICQAQINNKLSTAKSIFFRGQRNITGQNALFPNVYRTFLRTTLVMTNSLTLPCIQPTLALKDDSKATSS